MKTKLLLCMAFITVSYCALRAQGSEQPNVLFIIADDLGKYLPMYGDMQAYAPTIEEIGNNGLIFDRAYCNFPVCGPSRASMLTGIYPETIYGSTGLGYSNKDMKNYSKTKNALSSIDANAKPLLEYIKTQGGYFVLGGGKLYHDAESSKTKDFSNMVNTSSLPAYSKNVNNKVLVEDNHYFDDNEHRDGLLANTLANKIDAYANGSIGGGKPLFIAMGLQKPHGPYAAPVDYFEDFPVDRNDIVPTSFFDQPNDILSTYTFSPVENILKNYLDMELNGENYVDVSKGKRFSNLKPELQKKVVHAYYTCISFIDAQIKKVVDALKDNNLYDNTIIVLTSDHGYKLGHFDRLGKYSVHETDASVPLIISGPGVASGARTSSIAQLIDIYPTLCDLTETEIPSWCQGTSLRPVMSDPTNKVNRYAYTVVNKGGQWIGKSIIADDGVRYSRYVDKNNGNFIDPPGQSLSEEIYDYTDGNIYTANNRINDASYGTHSQKLNSAMDGFFTSGDYARIPETKTYYVSSSGSDTNDGLSENTPWQTLDKVRNASINPGDQVFFKRGDVFVGQLRPSYSGSGGHPITFAAYGTGDKPVLTGSGGSGGDHTSTIFINNQEYFDIKDLEIQNERLATRNGESDHESFGIFVWNNGTEVMSHFNFSNLTVKNVYPISAPSNPGGGCQGGFNSLKMAGIYLRSEKNTVAGQEKHIRDVTLTNSFFTRIGKFGFWSQHAGGADGIGNDSINRNMDYVLRNNHFLHTGGSGITPGGTYNLLVENNVFDYTGSSIDSRMVGRGSGAWFFNCRNVVAQYNKSYHARGSNDSYGMHIDFGNKYVILQYNYSEDNEGFVEILGDNLYATYRFNISVNDGRREKKGNTFWLSDFAGCNRNINSDELFVYNNTVFVDETPEGSHLRPGLMLYADNALIANNTIYAKRGSHIGYKQFDRDPLVQVDHNLYHGDIRVDDFTDQDANGVQGNPLYIAPGDLNAPESYKLEVGSPALGSGRAIVEPPFPMAGQGIFANITARATVDYFGNPVDLTGSGTNMGAYNGSGEPAQGNNGGTPQEGPVFEAEGAIALGGVDIVACSSYSGGEARKALVGDQRVVFDEIDVPSSGLYDIDVHYLTTTAKTLSYRVNGGSVQSAQAPSTGDYCWAGGTTGHVTLQVPLVAGLNTLTFESAPFLDKIELIPNASGGEYEAEDATLTGTAQVASCSNASGGKMVKNIDAGSQNGVEFTNIHVDRAGRYRVSLYYYAQNIRNIVSQTNGGDPVTTCLPATGDWCFQGGSPGESHMEVDLEEGNNTLYFYNAPILDKISVAQYPTGGIFEAENASLSGNAVALTCNAASGNEMVNNLVGGAANAVAFNNVMVYETGSYDMDISYMSTTARSISYQINNGDIQTISVQPSGSWCYQGGAPTDTTVTVGLEEGMNTIVVFDAKILDRIHIRSSDSSALTAVMPDEPIIESSNIESVLYPNPLRPNSTFNVKLMGGTNKASVVTLYDLQGVKVLERHYTNHDGTVQVPTGSLAKGLYLVHVRTRGEADKEFKLVVR
ncbi:MAG: sulfatase-like hydrolase/transferase [Flavobacteriaceae bacterium]